MAAIRRKYVDTKRIVISILIFFLLTVPAHADVPNKDIHIVYVEPPGEHYTREDFIQIRRNIQVGFDWWTTSPVPTAFTVLDEQVVTSTLDVFTNWDTSTYGQKAITIYVVDNRHSWQSFKGHSALAYIGSGPILLTSILMMEPHHSPIFSQTAMAHELGHSLYGLYDIYGTALEGKVGLDIMDRQSWMAYDHHFIGCYSLAQLGQPCKKTFLAYIGTQ